jgi:hypothetical protein
MEKEVPISSTDNEVPATVHQSRFAAMLFRYIPKKIVLMLLAVLCIAFFFILPANKKWFIDKLVDYCNDFRIQRKQLSLEQRKNKRFGTAYTYSKEIADFFEQKRIKNEVLVLVPGEAYFKKYGMKYEVPDPVAFYYFTALRTVGAKNKNAGRADWYVTVRDKKIYIDSVTTNTVLEDTIIVYKNF